MCCEQLEPRVVPSTLSGIVWHDLNLNEVQDVGEPGLAARIVYLDQNQNGAWDEAELSITTAADGSYSFIDLPSGEYTVATDLPAGWLQAFPVVRSGSNAFHAITVEADSVARADIGIHQVQGTIRGTLWEDRDLNGTFDPEEHVLAARTVYLDQNDNGEFDSNEISTTTDSFGRYSFSGLDVGTYTVAQVVPEGWFATVATREVEIPNEQFPVQRWIDLGKVAYGDVSGTHWEDLNGNGVRDVGDPGLADQQVSLVQSKEETFAYSGSNVRVRGRTTVTSQIDVSGVEGAGGILDVNVTIDGSFRLSSPAPHSDVRIISPTETEVKLFSDLNGASASGFSNTVLDDEATTSISDGGSPFTGTFQRSCPICAHGEAA